MKRSATGEYVTVSTLGERVEAFVPRPLPPEPPLEIDARLGDLVGRALVALGRLDTVSTILPDTAMFLYSYVRKEAVLSAQIEGTQSSLSDLLLFELDQAIGVPIDDVVEVSNYVAALDHGLSRLRGGFPISGRLIREMHRKLLSRGRGATRHPGEFRSSQVWIGGTRPGNAHFVPPPQSAVADCMAALERYIHDDRELTSILVRSALTHVQFETIHPFLDGNGRVGRLLITLQFCADGILREPLLYLSLFFKRHRSEYYRLLDAVRRDGDWEAWVGFFAEAVRVTAEDAVQTARQLSDLFRVDRDRIASFGRGGTSALRIHDQLQRRPVATVSWLCEATGLTFPTVLSALKRLEHISVVKELTGRKRNRVFAYDRYLTLMSEGTELG